jgi:hypothetical protein
MSLISDIRGRYKSTVNYFFPTDAKTNDTLRSSGGNINPKKNISHYIAPIQFQRLRQDIQSWREAIKEAENAYYPHRVKMQRLFQDTIINGHVKAAMLKRDNLTLLRDFALVDQKGKEYPDLKLLFRNNADSSGIIEQTCNWFDSYVQYVLDAKKFGYSLMSLGDIINNAFPEISLVKRWNVSPDRMTVSAFVYALTGQRWDEPDNKDWHVYVSTPTDVGASRCGYGYLYTIAPYEIFLRNNLSYNSDFNEVFNQPLKKGKTAKTEERERQAFFDDMRAMGSMAAILLDEGDEIDFVESKNVGSSYRSFESFELRMQRLINKIILGHADAMDSIPGNLGSQQGDEKSPISEALNQIQTIDGRFVENSINSQLIPRMRKLGFKIPLNIHLEYKNDAEKNDQREKEDENNQKTINIAVAMQTSGIGTMDVDYFTERTGIPVKAIPPPPVPIIAPPVADVIDNNDKNKTNDNNQGLSK